MIKWLFYISLCLWAVTWLLQDRLPDPARAHPELQREPVQTPLKAQPFTVEYREQKNTVQPVADYELWGLVVSHNDPALWTSFDITHDKQSLDTRDICVIWGDNITHGDYRRISFHNDDYACVWRWSSGSRQFNPRQISNNHLITDNEEVRRRIAQLEIGDQIHITGKLVNYSEQRWNGRFRNSSTTREDKGMGACEVVFAEHVEILDSPNHWIHLLHRAASWAALSAFILLLLA